MMLSATAVPDKRSSVSPAKTTSLDYKILLEKPVSYENIVDKEKEKENYCENEESEIDDSDDDAVTVIGMEVHEKKLANNISRSLSEIFAKQNTHLEAAIQSVEILNDQILSFVYSHDDEDKFKISLDGKNGNKRNYEHTLRTAIRLIHKLLLEVQAKFRKMVEENKSVAGRLDEDLQSAHRQMALLRAELNDTSKRLTQLASSPSPPSANSTSNNVGSTNLNNATNGVNEDKTSSISNGMENAAHIDDTSVSSGEDSPSYSLDLESLSSSEMRQEIEKLLQLNKSLHKDMKDLRGVKPSPVKDSETQAKDVHTELQHAKEALSALKGDRKRLKAEKFELLNQMKQLYATLEDKEKELRDFIRNYEQRMRESEASIKRLAAEREEADRERWSILRHAKEESDRAISLATQLSVRENQVQQLQDELQDAKRQLAQLGIYAEVDRSSSTTNATSSHYSLVSSLTATYATVGDRGSSADSGVRLSSDRDSAGGLPNAGNLSDSANEGVSLELGEGSGDGDSMSVVSTATLPQLFATSRDSPGPVSFASLARSLDTTSLSRSAEQLLAAEAAEARKRNSRRNGLEFHGKPSTGAKGAWGSISRVFARNKHRRTLDPHAYDGQRTSWSPQSSGPQSPLTEQESYADKLRALEEAAQLPMELWRASMVQAWIEVSLGMPQYGSKCADNVKSGKVLLELSDGELESELGIGHPLHRKKLRLAIEEHRNPALVRFPCIAELSHVWVSSEWLPDIGLPQYAENFAACLVDARLLDHLSKKDLEKYLGVTRKFHMASIAHGVHLLRIVGYDRQALAERRRVCESDPLVWTNQHFVQWARSVDLNEYAENLKGSGIHGAICVLEPSFNGDTLATAMGIPSSKQIIRRHLSTELEALLYPARAKITQQNRMAKGRMSTLEKQKSDSLGRNSSLMNENFRRSTDDRRRTSLRTYSHLFAQKGSLSRALGLKLKQDLLNRHDVEKTKTTPQGLGLGANVSIQRQLAENISYISAPLPPSGSVKTNMMKTNPSNSFNPMNMEELRSFVQNGSHFIPSIPNSNPINSSQGSSHSKPRPQSALSASSFKQALEDLANSDGKNGQEKVQSLDTINNSVSEESSSSSAEVNEELAESSLASSTNPIENRDSEIKKPFQTSV